MSNRKTKTKPFPAWPMHSDRELELVQEVVKSGQWWRMSGSKVEAFEQQFSKYQDVKYCMGVTNGTHAIQLALECLDIGKNDEVIIPAFTFVSTLTAVIYCNAMPIPVDVDKDTFCIDPDAIRKAITPRTKAIIPVHMAGHACDMDEICSIAKEHGLYVIEDAAHAHGAEYKGRKIGSFGEFATFSFQNGKIMTCGEGGAIVTNNDELYKKAFLIHGVGRPKNDRLYEHLFLGSNYRMNEFQAAVLIAQLERLDEHNVKRDKNAKALDELLSTIEGIEPQKYKEEASVNTHYMYMFYYNAEYFGGLTRNEFVNCLIEEGIPAYISYPAVYNTKFFKDKHFMRNMGEENQYREYYLENSEKIQKEVVWLPHYTLLGDEQDLAEIKDAILKIQAQYADA